MFRSLLTTTDIYRVKPLLPPHYHDMYGKIKMFHLQIQFTQPLSSIPLLYYFMNVPLLKHRCVSGISAWKLDIQVATPPWAFSYAQSGLKVFLNYQSHKDTKKDLHFYELPYNATLSKFKIIMCWQTLVSLLNMKFQDNLYSRSLPDTCS